MTFNCILCKSEKFKIISPRTRDGEQKIIKCQNCSHIQIFPLPKDLEEKTFYDEDKQTKLLYENVDTTEFEKRASADTQRRVEKVKEKFKTSSSILDVGCGYGFFVKAVNKMGFRATGLEISRQRREIAQKVTCNKVLSSPITRPNKGGSKFDIITLFHVFEHIKNPSVLASNLKTYLKKNGVLIIEVPNADDYQLKFNKNYRNFFWQRAHISYFTPKKVTEVLEKAGFKSIKITGIQRYGIKNALNWTFRGKPQLKNPKFQSTKFSAIEQTYKNLLTKKLKCDTLWIEAKAN